jgi:hypothetical protein
VLLAAKIEYPSVFHYFSDMRAAEKGGCAGDVSISYDSNQNPGLYYRVIRPFAFKIHLYSLFVDDRS